MINKFIKYINFTIQSIKKKYFERYRLYFQFMISKLYFDKIFNYFIVSLYL